MFFGCSQKIQGHWSSSYFMNTIAYTNSIFLGVTSEQTRFMYLFGFRHERLNPNYQLENL